MLTAEKQRRRVKKPDLSAGLPQDVSYLLLLVDESEEDKTMSCISNHLRFTEVVEKLLQRINSELSRYKERIEELKVCACPTTDRLHCLLRSTMHFVVMVVSFVSFRMQTIQKPSSSLLHSTGRRCLPSWLKWNNSSSTNTISFIHVMQVSVTLGTNQNSVLSMPRYTLNIVCYSNGVY